MSEIVNEAIAAIKRGERAQAQQLLRQVVQQTPQNAKAWLWLSEVEEEVGNKIIALENAILLKPAWASKVQNRVDELKQQQIQAARIKKTVPSQVNYLRLALDFENQGEFEQAAATYQTALKHAIGPDRLTAEKRLIALQRRIERRNNPHLKETNPTMTVLRLAAGPPLLYSLLIFIHSGLNPRFLSPWLCSASFLVLAGSFLLTAALNTPNHPQWQQWLKQPEGLNKNNQKTAVLIALIFIVLPFLFMLIGSLRRL